MVSRAALAPQTARAAAGVAPGKGAVGQWWALPAVQAARSLQTSRATLLAEAAPELELEDHHKAALRSVKPKVCMLITPGTSCELECCNFLSTSVCVQLLIGGKFEDATGGGTFETFDPRTGEVLMSVAEATAEDVDRAVKAARHVRLLRSHALHVCVHICQA